MHDSLVIHPPALAPQEVDEPEGIINSERSQGELLPDRSLRDHLDDVSSLTNGLVGRPDNLLDIILRGHLMVEQMLEFSR